MDCSVISPESIQIIMNGITSIAGIIGGVFVFYFLLKFVS